MTEPIEPGAIVGPYRVLRLLAAGGMGQVFLARDVRLGRVVALKFAHALLGSDPRVREQFLVEARTTASLSHPNVVTVFDVGEHDGGSMGSYFTQRFKASKHHPRSRRSTARARFWDRWSKRDTRTRVVATTAIEDPNWVQQAFAEHAESIVLALPRESLDVVRSVLLPLAKDLSSASLTRDDFEREHSTAASVIEALIEGRVLSYHAPTDALTLAFSGLASSWERLKRWVEEADTDRKVIRELNETAARWHERDEQPGALWYGKTLLAAEALVGRRPEVVSSLALRFVEGGRAAQRRSDRRGQLIRATLVTSLALITATAVVAAWALFARQKHESIARARADQDRAELLVQGAIQRYLSKDPLMARAMLRSALEMRDDIKARALLAQLRQEPLLWSVPSASRPYSVAYSPDGSLVFAAMQNGEIWSIDARSGEHRVLHRTNDQALEPPSHV